MFHIVDDDLDVRTFLAEVLGLMGYETESFGCPRSYLEYAKSDAFIFPYALLTDVQMPTMNGYEMLDHVRQLHPEIRTAVISGFPKHNGKAKTRSCAFLTKPLEIAKFEHVIQSFVNCCEDGPNAGEYGCDTPDKHEDFGLKGWSCPHGKHCENC